MAHVHKHKWEYPPDTQLVRKCLTCGLVEKKIKLVWVSQNWTIKNESR